MMVSTGTYPDDAEVVAVDRDGEVQEAVSRVDAHTGEGRLHRAFLTPVYRADRSEVLLARRHQQKQVFGGYWDGTVASHSQPGQDQEEAVAERVCEELGVDTDSSTVNGPTFRFVYRAEDPEGLFVEYEVCAVYETVLTDDAEISVDPDEISETVWADADILHTGGTGENYLERPLTPWFDILLCIQQRNPAEGSRWDAGTYGTEDSIQRIP